MRGRARILVEVTTVGIFAFDDVEVLDLCGPFEVFSRSAGVAAGIDMALSVVESIHGKTVADETRDVYRVPPSPLTVTSGSPAPAICEVARREFTASPEVVGRAEFKKPYAMPDSATARHLRPKSR